MRMNLENLTRAGEWQALGVVLPKFDIAAMRARSQNAPTWVHLGTGNIFRSFIAALAQRLLNEGLTETGIVAAEPYDGGIIRESFAPYDDLAMNVTLRADGAMDCEILASVAEAFAVSQEGRARLAEIFRQPSLQMASFTITEKGYALRAANQPPNTIDIVTDMLFERYLAGAFPIALVSLDNCSANGDKLRAVVLATAERRSKKEFGVTSADLKQLRTPSDDGFMQYLRDETRVAFPWTMIDKITPRPAEAVCEMLTKKGIEQMSPAVTERGTYTAPFVNAERPQYLVVEDTFPNGRPPLERAGVIFTDRDTVGRTERMKVTTCLNPLHTAMSVYGCLLGYTRICDEMRDGEIVALVRRLGYEEGLPVVVDPGILSPRAFIDEVVNERLPNPFIPDTPQRIATDTSQKVGIRFGETIKSYANAKNRPEGGADERGGLTARKPADLIAVPLAIAGWLRYLLAVDDRGNPMEVSPDPMKESLQTTLASVCWNDPSSFSDQLDGILSDAGIFGSDLTTTGLAARVKGYFCEMLGGPGSVRATLRKALGN